MTKLEALKQQRERLFNDMMEKINNKRRYVNEIIRNYNTEVKKLDDEIRFLQRRK